MVCFYIYLLRIDSQSYLTKIQHKVGSRYEERDVGNANSEATQESETDEDWRSWETKGCKCHLRKKENCKTLLCPAIANRSRPIKRT